MNDQSVVRVVTIVVAVHGHTAYTLFLVYYPHDWIIINERHKTHIDIYIPIGIYLYGGRWSVMIKLASHESY